MLSKQTNFCRYGIILCIFPSLILNHVPLIALFDYVKRDHILYSNMMYQFYQCFIIEIVVFCIWNIVSQVRHTRSNCSCMNIIRHAWHLRHLKHTIDTIFCLSTMNCSALIMFCTVKEHMMVALKMYSKNSCSVFTTIPNSSITWQHYVFNASLQSLPI